MWNASKCDLCGICLERCLYVDYDKKKAAADIKDLMDGRPADILSKCVTCCACSEYCPTGADPFDLILNAMEKYKSFPIKPEAVGFFGMASSVPNQVIKGRQGKPVLSLCVMEMSLPPDAIGGQMFDDLTIAKGGDYFCYLGYVHAGMETPLAENARKFIDNVAGLGDEIIFLHDDCYAMVDAKVRDYGIEVPFKYMHILEYMRNYLRDNKGKITKLGVKAAYQRPCASRYTPAKDVFVDEIFDLIGVERPKREYEREKALCCTGAFVKVYPQLAAEVQAKNVDDAIRYGADVLVTLCPMCDRVLRRPTTERGLRKVFITDLVRMALGEKTFPA
ncbi:MAG: (Fe-S)-binding protein [Dehalococcoidia bacterium]|nr:(Fe-S)-binding protein [Dehalococcoidia bacterium]